MVRTSLSLMKVHCIFGMLILLLFWVGGVLHGLRYLSSQIRNEPMFLAAKAWSPNYWTSREFPYFVNLYVERWIAISSTLISSF